MKRFTAQKAYLVGMLILSVFISSSLVYGGSDEHVKNYTAPDALEAIALFAGFGDGTGMTNQGMYTEVNGDSGTTAAATLVTGFHDTRAVYTETTSTIGTVKGTRHKAHPQCQDSCSL